MKISMKRGMQPRPEMTQSCRASTVPEARSPGSMVIAGGDVVGGPVFYQGLFQGGLNAPALPIHWPSLVSQLASHVAVEAVQRSARLGNQYTQLGSTAAQSLYHIRWSLGEKALIRKLPIRIGYFLLKARQLFVSRSHSTATSIVRS